MADGRTGFRACHGQTAASGPAVSGSILERLSNPTREPGRPSHTGTLGLHQIAQATVVGDHEDAPRSGRSVGVELRGDAFIDQPISSFTPGVGNTQTGCESAGHAACRAPIEHQLDADRRRKRSPKPADHRSGRDGRRAAERCSSLAHGPAPQCEQQVGTIDEDALHPGHRVR